MGTYRQPMMLQPLDFSRVSSKLSEAGKSIVNSFNQRQALRLARAEEFKSDYKKYAEKVILDNNEYLADETREIMQENLLNIDNFAAMSEGDRLKTMASVQSFNNSNKIASKLVNELGAMELDARSWDDPVVQITQAYVSGNFEDVKRIPHTNGKIGADFEVSLRDKNGELTGEKRLVTQNEFIARGNNILTTSPESDIETVNTTVSDLIQQHQKNLDDFSSRGGTYDPTNKIRQYFETMDEEVLDTYYGNVFRKGDDYLEIPDTDVNGNKLTDEDKQVIFETKREELINHLTGRVTNELVKKPYPKTTAAGGSGKYAALSFDQGLYDDVSRLKYEMDMVGPSASQRQLESSQAMIGRSIEIQGENKTIIDTYVKGGLFYVVYEGPYDQQEGGKPALEQAFSLDRPDDLYYALRRAEGRVSGIPQSARTQSQATTSNDPLGLGIN